jgi:hypothetical protein
VTPAGIALGSADQKVSGSEIVCIAPTYMELPSLVRHATCRPWTTILHVGHTD